MASSSKSIEQLYQKKDLHQHILDRPGMYVGDNKKLLEEIWVYDDQNSRFTKRPIEYSPALLKIFDEVLVNALDHSIRDNTVNAIKINVDKETGMITVWNNGTGIPIVEHKEHLIYIPELIFGNLLTSTNYDDTQSRIVGGMNGLGSKLTNIYSTKFIVETVDSERSLKYKQEFSDNMYKKSKPKITKCSTKSFTQISFIPDWKRFDMTNLEDDTILMFKKRVYDCVACSDKNVTVYWNGEKLHGKTFLDYISFYFPQSDAKDIFYDKYEMKVGKNMYVWEVGIVPYTQFEQVSFVNGINTTQGGKHVDTIVYQVVNKLKNLLETKKKIKDVKPSVIKERFFLFLRSTISNPSFSSQTKEYLSTAPKDFGCKVEVSDKFVEKLYKSSITEEIVAMTKLKETLELAKQTDGKKRSIIRVPKLEDAIWAGTGKSNQCTLILTEGESAKTFAMWGRAVVGPEKFGVFPLKGKCNSEDTQIPLWNGEIKLAKDIQIGDILIGDDGNKRTVLTLYKGNGKMYEVQQDRGESYKVNDEHILTLCIPEHKKIFWVPSKYAWRTIYWDTETKNIKAKESQASIKVECKECGIMINTKCLKRHYKRKHKNTKYVPYKLQNQNMDDPKVIEARKKLEEFLLKIDDNNIIDISIYDYLNVTDSFKRKLKGIRGQCVNWEYQDVLLDPYVLGLWLGDDMKSGYAYSCDGKNDIEIMDYLKEWGIKNDANFKRSSYNNYTYYISSIDKFGKQGQSPLKKLLSKYNLINDKHIPKEYLINSKEIRLRLLAGIVDTDGYVCSDGTIEISQTTKHKKLVEDIVYLSRSLGFYTYLANKTTNYTYDKTNERAMAYRIKISGDTSIIPTILPRKKSRNTEQYNIRNSTGPIRIREIPNENYVGIGIDGNHRFVINDFTVTHNCLNIRDATTQQLINNQEINNIKQILGLKQGKVYENTNDLRYGKLLILTDSDVDGSHIKSLILNIFHYWWPSLLKLNFIQTMRTPIVKAFKGNVVKEFFTQQDYEQWEQDNKTGNWKIKYYKGLGTSKREDAKDCFNRFSELQSEYIYKDENCDKAILLAFEKDKNAKNETVKYTDKRKEWLKEYDRKSFLDYRLKQVPIQDFIHKELIHFSNYDNLRSIPNMCDGLKPSQRKILYYCLKKKIYNNEIKVAQLSGYVSAETSYHHGEASLQGAIVGMAQDFVGSNNLNILLPDSNFGSRYEGGKDAASPRYIFTRLNPISNIVFNQHDLPLLNYQEEDGQSIEPEWYMPVIPMVLVNGCEGIGTGYSTYVPPHNPTDIIANIERLLEEKELLPLFPWWKGFKGEVSELETCSYISKGKYKRHSDTQISITELPIGVWVTPYKEFLESLVDDSSSKSNKSNRDPILKDVQNKTTDENNGINFIVEFKNKKILDNLIKTNTLEKELKLTKTFGTGNMYLFDSNYKLFKYDTANDILKDFYRIRLDFYGKRKNYLTNLYQEQLDLISSKVRFITEYLDGILDINKKNKSYVIDLLEKRSYKKVEGSYDYLVQLPMITLTLEKIQELESKKQELENTLVSLTNKTPKDLWKEDLVSLKSKLKA